MSYTLTFSQLVGEFVTDKELLGAQDPYVVFEAGGRKTQTKAIKSSGSENAIWKETYTLHEFSPSGSSVLEVTVYNHNTLRPDGTLGSGTVNLSNLGENQLSGSGDRVTVALTDKKGKNVGALKFIIHGGGFSGSGSHTGHHTGSGVGAGAAGAAGGAAGIGAGHHGHHSGHQTGTGTGQVTGVGAGSNYGTAKHAADRAATENRDVTVQDREGVAAGRPTGTTGTGAGYTDSTRGTTGTGHHHTGTTSGLSASGVRGLDVQPGEVIDRKYYTGTENRPQEQALVEQYREHNPYAKQYETTVQHTGRERLVGSSIEALGTNERVIGQDHHVHAHPHDHIARALPKGAVADRPGGEGWVQGKAGPVCDSTTFEVTGDRTVDKERVTNLREHREFEKEFEVKTALTGERNLERGADTEQLNRERVLLDEKNKIACEGHPNVDATTGGTGTRGISGGSGYGTGSGTTAGTGYGTGAQTGSGIGSGSATSAGTGSGYGAERGSGVGGTGTGTGYTGSATTGNTGSATTATNPTSGMSTTQKLASLVPGTQANRERKEGL